MTVPAMLKAIVDHRSKAFIDQENHIQRLEENQLTTSTQLSQKKIEVKNLSVEIEKLKKELVEERGNKLTLELRLKDLQNRFYVQAGELENAKNANEDLKLRLGNSVDRIQELERQIADKKAEEERIAKIAELELKVKEVSGRFILQNTAFTTTITFSSVIGSTVGGPIGAAIGFAISALMSISAVKEPELEIIDELIETQVQMMAAKGQKDSGGLEKLMSAKRVISAVPDILGSFRK